MAAPKAPVLDQAGKKAKDMTLEEAIFGAEVKQHVVHETVRAELNARRAGTRAAKSRGLVYGGRSKPWRQKGTGRARAGSIRAPQWTGGGVAFAPQPRSFDVKVNRKVRRAALRGALSSHASAGTLGTSSSVTFKTGGYSTLRLQQVLARRRTEVADTQPVGALPAPGREVTSAQAAVLARGDVGLTHPAFRGGNVLVEHLDVVADQFLGSERIQPAAN